MHRLQEFHDDHVDLRERNKNLPRRKNSAVARNQKPTNHPFSPHNWKNPDKHLNFHQMMSRVAELEAEKKEEKEKYQAMCLREQEPPEILPNGEQGKKRGLLDEL